MNPYVFCNSNPNVWRDPSGQTTLLGLMTTVAVRTYLALVAANTAYSAYNFFRGFKEGWNRTLRGDPLEQALTAIVSVGDGATGGLSELARNLVFEDQVIDTQSLAYQGVEVVGGLSALKGFADAFRTVVKGSTNFIIYTARDGTKRIRFRADAAVTSNPPRSHAPTNETLAGVTTDGRVVVHEGRHRAIGAAHGDEIPEHLGGVPDQPGWLDYEFSSNLHSGAAIPIVTF